MKPYCEFYMKETASNIHMTPIHHFLAMDYEQCCNESIINAMINFNPEIPRAPCKVMIRQQNKELKFVFLDVYNN